MDPDERKKAGSGSFSREPIEAVGANRREQPREYGKNYLQFALQGEGRIDDNQPGAGKRAVGAWRRDCQFAAQDFGHCQTAQPPGQRVRRRTRFDRIPNR